MDALRVTTADGLLEGSLDGSVSHFLGIPFARPPVGELRWRPPEPALPWPGIRSARGFGNPCMQHVDAIPVIHERQPTPSEDCLYLNVWTPHGGSRLPVMVWFHGGAFVVGSGSAAEFDGRRLAATGVVVVTVNYRLGPFGFFAHPGVGCTVLDRAAGNYGLLDQRAALQWIQVNIATFGGDPGNVTIFGESAGGISVSCHVASPRSEGLFAKAISQSATWFTIPHGLPDAHSAPDLAAADAQRFATDSAASTRAGSWTICARSVRRTSSTRPTGSPCSHQLSTAGSCQRIRDAAAAGRVQHVPYLLGWNADEGSRFVAEGRGSPAALDFARRAAIEPVRSVARAMRSQVFLYRFNRVPATDLAKQFATPWRGSALRLRQPASRAGLRPDR